MRSNAAAERIRSRNDRALFERLASNPEVKRVAEALERQSEKGPTGTRRRLLATSVRLSARMAPAVQRHADACVERLGLDIPIELFVFASPSYNAACFKPEEGRLFVMFSSSLLEAFDDAEVRFVMGHELGHYAYNHHDIPIGIILRGGKPEPRLALQLFTWSRFAEISADRAGAFCAGDIEAVSRSLFKLASGLSGNTIEFHLDDFLAQVDDMKLEDEEPGQRAPREDWFSTHPFSPLRVKALQLFDRSELMRSGGDSVDALEAGVQDVMGLMEASYLEGRTDAHEAMRRLLFAGALSIANADGTIDDEERETFERFFGEGAFDDRLDLDALAEDLGRRAARVREVATMSQAMAVLQDLCVMARADDHSKEAEREVLHRIADDLGIERTFVCQAMDGELELD